ncbi:Hypothetical predicted protein [Xyrichtys novacula]|uniref:Uncharacterized protein n=1 Tax=Xyrichtys novacula TaxID=13765 RepID=A0AAV1FNM9_XYRNO|nr:Hypothetical predicted protein [Xyrichtys novacula]
MYDTEQHISPLHLHLRRLSLAYRLIAHPVKQRSAEDEQRGSEKVHVLYLDSRLAAAVEAELLFVICSDVECATCRRTAAKGERSRQVIQDYSDDMPFPWTCYFCSGVFCAKHGVQPHLSAPNSPLAPINGAPWTSIDDEIMSSRCLVNAIPYFLLDSHAPKLPLASFSVCRALW